VRLTNWRSLQIFEKGYLVGHIEEAHVIDSNEDGWQQKGDTMIRINTDTVKNCQEELSSRLVYGEHCTLEECKPLQQLMYANHDVFAPKN